MITIEITIEEMTTPIANSVMVVASFMRTIVVVIAPGPAIMGRAMGIIAISSVSRDSYFSVAVSFVRDVFAYTISIPIPKSRIPPAIRNASRVMPNSCRIHVPASATRSNMISA